jgi:signal transduction histidine kinase
MQECISEAASELSRAIEKKGLELRFHAMPGIPRFRFDRGRMHQVFANLLDNACKYTCSGGSIDIRCEPYFWERRTVPEAVEAARERRGRNGTTCFNSVRVSVEDTGVGVERESVADIFEAYTRETNGAGYSKGFGLGLAIARQIVLAHEGRIWAERNEGQGSVFTVLVPTSL